LIASVLFICVGSEEIWTSRSGLWVNGVVVRKRYLVWMTPNQETGYASLIGKFLIHPITDISV
jgi:hypothetical protein